MILLPPNLGPEAELHNAIYTARLLWPAMWCPITQLLH